MITEMIRLWNISVTKWAFPLKKFRGFLLGFCCGVFGVFFVGDFGVYGLIPGIFRQRAIAIGVLPRNYIIVICIKIVLRLRKRRQ
jgi:hypothetical protein